MQGYKAEKLIIQYKADKSLSNRYVLDGWKFWHSLDPVTGCDMEDIFTDSLKNKCNKNTPESCLQVKESSKWMTKEWVLTAVLELFRLSLHIKVRQALWPETAPSLPTASAALPNGLLLHFLQICAQTSPYQRIFTSVILRQNNNAHRHRLLPSTKP